VITGISLKNFKCFEDEYIELSNLTLLAGINGMGKSTVIQSILLLRQSYFEKVLQKGISLNGEFISIGTGKDLLYERAEEPEHITIGIEFDNAKQNLWTAEYSASSNFLNLINCKLELNYDNVNIFTDKFQYLYAERLGPRNTFAKSNYNVVEHRQIGIRGEYVQHYLYVYGRENIKNLNVKADGVNELDLISQTQGWLNLISPNVQIQLHDYSKADIMNLQYKFVDYEVSNEYRPTNVGFGITYVLPVIVALLKAEAGDLVIIENPEAHIHPRGQRILGELIAKSSSGGVQVIIETHSDHILNGIRLSVRNKYLDKNSAKIDFFEKVEINNNYKHRVLSPNINEDGRLDFWPEGFFDEWDKALDELFD
jgi:predicted ATPase